MYSSIKELDRMCSECFVHALLTCIIPWWTSRFVNYLTRLFLSDSPVLMEKLVLWLTVYGWMLARWLVGPLTAVQLLKSAEHSTETWQNVASLTVAAQKVNVVKYGKLDHQILIGLHANSCYSVRSQWSPAFCLFLSNLSLIYEVAIGQPK
jgi:hypothetical protein